LIGGAVVARTAQKSGCSHDWLPYMIRWQRLFYKELFGRCTTNWPTPTSPGAAAQDVTCAAMPPICTRIEIPNAGYRWRGWNAVRYEENSVGVIEVEAGHADPVNDNLLSRKGRAGRGDRRSVEMAQGRKHTSSPRRKGRSPDAYQQGSSSGTAGSR